MSLLDIYTGVISSLVAFPLILLIVTMFRNTKYRESPQLLAARKNREAYKPDKKAKSGLVRMHEGTNSQSSMRTGQYRNSMSLCLQVHIPATLVVPDRSLRSVSVSVYRIPLGYGKSQLHFWSREVVKMDGVVCGIILRVSAHVSTYQGRCDLVLQPYLKCGEFGVKTGLGLLPGGAVCAVLRSGDT